jgi:hypothetical protein
MKRTVPLLITAIVGFVLVCSAFIPAAETWGEKALIWFDLLAGIAFILGGGNLVGAQLKKISNRRPGWGYAAVTLVAFLITLGVGVLKMGVRPAPNQEFFGESFSALAPSELPVITLAATLPDDAAKLPLPPSVRRQVTIKPGEIEVRGWLSGAQIADLSDVDPTLAWKCAVEQLAGLAVPPAAFRGRLAYRPDHRALAFRGTMSPEDETALKQLNATSTSFATAVDSLAVKSRRESSVTAPAPPPGFALPQSLNNRVNIADGTIRFVGPMSSAERAALTTEALRSRIAYPLSTAALDAFIARLAAGSPFQDAQTEILNRLLFMNWSDDLIAAVNTAGVAKPGVKTACQLIADRNAGVTDLDPAIPAPPGVELNADQKAAIASFVTAETHDWAALVVQLKAAGPLTDAQAAAVEEFRGELPTIGERDRKLFDELIAILPPKAAVGVEEIAQTLAPRPLTAAQREMLLADYRVEHDWHQAVARLFTASHQVKYAWSGEFNQQGSQFWWLFEYIYQPILSMMFALLAFYVASAAFRAFRAKNLEAILLLGTAFIILLGRTYAGMLVTDWLPKGSPLRLENLSVDIMRVFNVAGNRAIMIGIALGIASTSLKILLGIDRSHTGGKD